MTKTLGIASFCIVFLCLEPFGRSADCKVAAAPVSDSPLRSAMENALLGHTLSVRELDALEAGKAERERWRPYPVQPARRSGSGFPQLEHSRTPSYSSAVKWI